MGRPKLLLPVAGRSLIAGAVAVAETLSGQNIVVTGAYDREIRRVLVENTTVNLIHNPDWENGMGSSINTGVSAVNPTDCRGILVMLADQPRVDGAFLKKIIQRYDTSPATIVATKYPSGPGVPAVFSPEHYRELIALTSSGGAKDLIRNRGYLVDEIELPGGNVDIDTPEDYLAFTGKTLDDLEGNKTDH